MAKKIWKAEVEIYTENYTGFKEWSNYSYQVLANTIRYALKKVVIVIKKDFRHRRYRINSIVSMGELDE